MQIKSWEYIIQTKKEHIDFINKIIEAYDGLGNVRTLDNQNGLIKILTNSYLNRNSRKKRMAWSIIIPSLFIYLQIIANLLNILLIFCYCFKLKFYKIKLQL